MTSAYTAARPRLSLHARTQAKSARHARADPAIDDRVALATIAANRSVLVATAITTRRRAFEGCASPDKKGATSASGTAASQYMAPMVGYTNTPLARRSPNVSNESSRKSPHTLSLAGKAVSISAVVADSEAPTRSASVTRRATSGDRVSLRAAKNTRTPERLRSANLSASCR